MHYEGQLYKCNTNIASPGEAWNSSHWNAVYVSDELVAIDDKVENIVDNINIPASRNLFDKSTIISGYYLNQNNGNVSESASHGYCEQYISVEGTFTISNDGTTPMANMGLRIIYYNEQKEFISGILSPTGSAYDSTLERCYVTLTAPENTKFIRMSCTWWGSTYSDKNVQVENGSTPTAYVDYSVGSTTIKIKKSVLPDDTQAASNVAYQSCAHTAKFPMPTVTAATLTDQQKIELPRISFHGNKIYSFYALITSFSGVRVGNEESYDGTWVEVDATNIYVKRKLSDVATSYTYAHGLTFKDYILVVISVDTSAKATITLATNGGTWTQGNLGYEGRNGKIQAISQGSSFTNAVLSYSSNCYRSKVWAIGDSYLSNANSARWGYYVKTWGNAGYAFIGYPGEASEAGYADFLTCLENGCPMYAIWTHGMNNQDSGSAINADWVTYVEAFLDKCEELNITPILCTIPNTPTHLNTFKNAWVKASGYRYIDFAAAVGASEANSSWFDNMLSEDNVHPDVQGAIALASAAITGCPELQLSL